MLASLPHTIIILLALPVHPSLFLVPNDMPNPANKSKSSNAPRRSKGATSSSSPPPSSRSGTPDSASSGGTTSKRKRPLPVSDDTEDQFTESGRLKRYVVLCCYSTDSLSVRLDRNRTSCSSSERNTLACTNPSGIHLKCSTRAFHGSPTTILAPTH